MEQDQVQNQNSQDESLGSQNQNQNQSDTAVSGTESSDAAPKFVERLPYDDYFSQFDSSSEPASGDQSDEVAKALLTTLDNIKSEIASLKAAGKPQEAAAVAEKADGFAQRLQAGDIEGAQAALESAAISRIESQVLDRAVEQATRKALVAAQAQAEISNYGQQLLKDHPGLAEVADLVEDYAQNMMRRAVAEGKVQAGDVPGYVSALKSALKQSAARFSRITSTQRAAGAAGASARHAEVLQSTTIAPGAMQEHGDEGPGGDNPLAGKSQAEIDREWLRDRAKRTFSMKNPGMQRYSNGSA